MCLKTKLTKLLDSFFLRHPPHQKKTIWGKTVHKKTRRGRTLARVGRKGEMA